MLGKQAKVLGSRDIADLLAFAECSRHPLRNRVIVLLSAKAGLRAGEIAGLTWRRCRLRRWLFDCADGASFFQKSVCRVRFPRAFR